MGAEPWSTWVPGELDPKKALERGRREVFTSGAYYGADEKPGTVEDALELAGESGTGSILDITGISDEEEPGRACGLSPDDLEYFFDSLTPSKEEVEACDDVWEGIGRGCARYIVAYQGGVPAGIMFLGYSYD